MSQRPPANPERQVPHRAEQIAAEWFIRRDRGLSAEEERELAHWLSADPRHVEIFAELEEAWSLMGKVEAPILTEVPPVKKSPHWGRWAVPLAIAAAVVVVLADRAWLTSFRRPSASVFTQSAVTAVGQDRRLELPDGSVLQMNTDSAVDVRLTATEREVRLTRGEVQFQVTSNPARPFVVRVDGVDVHDVGTVFDVRLKPETVDVLVTEGQVRVVDGAGNQSLVAGESAVIQRGLAAGPAPAITRVDSATSERQLAWRQHQLVFSTETLAEIVSEFNRYNVHKLVIADPALASQRFGGSFPTNDYGSLVKLLQKNFGVVAESHGDQTVLRSAAP